MFLWVSKPGLNWRTISKTDLIVPTSRGVAVILQDHSHVWGVIFVVLGLCGRMSEPTESVDLAAVDPRTLICKKSVQINALTPQLWFKVILPAYHILVAVHLWGWAWSKSNWEDPGRRCSSCCIPARGCGSRTRRTLCCSRPEKVIGDLTNFLKFSY